MAKFFIANLAMNLEILWKVQVEQHLKTQEHNKLDSRHSNKTSQALISCSSTFGNSGNTFKTELSEALILIDIPHFKINSPQLRTFLSKYTNETIPSDSSL